MQNQLRLGWVVTLLLLGLAPPGLWAGTGIGLEDFEAGHPPTRWTFSHGAEFPGAQGEFQRSTEAAHDGQFGGRLSFDFTRGGNYVAAILPMPQDGASATGAWDGLRLWLKRPEGNDVVLRTSDASGQTFQKPIECAADRWVRVTIPFSGWTAHWGGPNDGTMRGRPRTLAVLIERGLQTTGALLFDDLQWVDAREAVARVSFPAYRFTGEEGWSTQTEGHGGVTRLEGRIWTADFSQGARSISLAVPDRVLLGNVDIHPYRTHLNDLAFIDDLREASDAVRLPDGTRRPVWLTEMGWATHTPHHVLRQDFAATTPRTQAELITRSYLCSIVSGVEPRTFWDNFRNDGEDPIYFEHQMGIVHHDFTPKPAYVAYATLTRLLRGQRVAGPVPAPPGVLAFSFKPAAGGPGETIVVWSPQADAVVELPITGTSATRINGVGEQSELPVLAGKLSLALKKGAPLYLQIPARSH